MAFYHVVIYNKQISLKNHFNAICIPVDSLSTITSGYAYTKYITNLKVVSFSICTSFTTYILLLYGFYRYIANHITFMFAIKYSRALFVLSCFFKILCVYYQIRSAEGHTLTVNITYINGK